MILLKFLLSCVGIIYRGFVFKTMWLWFVVPTFGLPELSIPVAIGLIYVSCVFRPSETIDEIEKTFKGISDELYFQVLLYSFLHSALILGLGWIVKQFL